MARETTSMIGPDQADFYRQNVDWLLKMAIFRCHDRELAQDLVQETFLKLFRGWSERKATRAYVARVLVSCHLDEIRRRRSRAQEVAADPDVLSSVASTGPEPSSEVEEEVRAAIRDLPAQQREVVSRVYFDGLSLAETAREMGLGPKTVHNYHHLAKKRLEASLANLADAREGAAQ